MYKGRKRTLRYRCVYANSHFIWKCDVVSPFCVCVTRSAGSQKMAFSSLNYRTKKPQLHINNTKGMKGEENNNQNKNPSLRIGGHFLSSVLFFMKISKVFGPPCKLCKYYPSGSIFLSLSQWWMCLFAHIAKSTIRATSDHSRRTWSCQAVIGSSVTCAGQPHNYGWCSTVDVQMFNRD